jgi:hypothetical protein
MKPSLQPKTIRFLLISLIFNCTFFFAHVANAQLLEFYQRSSSSGSWSQSSFYYCGSTGSRDLAVEFYYCHPTYPKDICDIGGVGANPYKIKAIIYKDGVEVTSKEYRTSKVWANFFFYGFSVSEGTYKARVIAKKRKLFSWETVYDSYANSIACIKIAATPNFNINGSTADVIEVNASSITVNAAATTCESKYYIGVAESDRWWHRTYDYEWGRWFTGTAPNGINLQQYSTTYSYPPYFTGDASRQGSPLIGGKLDNGNDRYYRVGIATGEPTWVSKTLLIKVNGNQKSTSGTDNIEVIKTIEQSLDKEQLFSFKPYPNPTTDRVMLDVLCREDVKATIRLFNLSGQMMNIQSDYVLSKGTNTINIDLSGIEPGIYIIGVISGGNIQYEKLIVK